MECMLGNLRTMINTCTFKDGQSPYSYPSALFMMSFIAKGVKDLHANGILHKDLKASNILVGIRVEMSNWVPEGQAELVDLLDINRVKIGDYEITEGMIGSAFWRCQKCSKCWRKEPHQWWKRRRIHTVFQCYVMRYSPDLFTFDSMKDQTTISYFQGRDQSFLLLWLRIWGACWRVVGTNQTKVQILKDQVCSVS